MPGSAPRATLNNPYGPAITFRTEDVLPPSSLYISMNDTLIAFFSVGLAGTAFTMTCRVLLPDGTIQVEAYTSVTPINPTVPYIALPPVEGYLLSLAVFRNDTVNCNAWVTISLYKGAAQNPIVSLPPNAGAVLAQGEVSELSLVSWPNMPVNMGGTGPGTMRSVALSAAAGANFSVQVTSNQRWQVVSLTFSLATSAAAGTRDVLLQVLDQAGNGVGNFAVAATQAPSTALIYSFFSGAANGLVATPFVNAPLPAELMLDPGMVFRSAVQSLDAADAITSGFMLVREWMGVGHP